MLFRAVLNRDGGTLRTMDIEALGVKAKEIFAAEGHQLEFAAVPGDEVEASLRKAAADETTEVLLAGGGDGTISTAAEIAFESKVPLAVLPAGTMNLFARALGLPLDMEEALRAIAGGTIESVDIATANGEAFVHQYGVGIHARLVRIRDGLSYNSRVGKMLASLRAIAAAAVDPPQFDVDITTSRGQERRKTSGIAVSNNPLGEGHFPHADTLDRGVLGVYVTAPLTTAELARLAIEVMLGRWRHNPMVWESEVRKVQLRFPRRKRRDAAVIDGELVDLDREVNIELHPKALRVVVPKIEK